MMSSVAGILDQRGGLRVVVTQRGRMRNHIKKGERLFVVPDMVVEEPVPWDDIPALIAKVQKHVTRSIAPHNSCGECHACCILPHIKAKNFDKPSMVMCEHCEIGFGCKAYASRPDPCKTFQCMWLKSQSRNDRMPNDMRPDKCGTMFTNDMVDPLVFEVHTVNFSDPSPRAWQFINEMQAIGYKAKKVTSYVGEMKK